MGSYILTHQGLTRDSGPSSNLILSGKDASSPSELPLSELLKHQFSKICKISPLRIHIVDLYVDHAGLERLFQYPYPFRKVKVLAFSSVVFFEDLLWNYPFQGMVHLKKFRGLGTLQKSEIKNNFKNMGCEVTHFKIF